MDCDDCLERLPELESYCRFCLTGRYTQTLPIALFVERPQGGAGFWVTCRHLSGAEVLTMQVDEATGRLPPQTFSSFCVVNGVLDGLGSELLSNVALNPMTLNPKPVDFFGSFACALVRTPRWPLCEPL